MESLLAAGQPIQGGSSSLALLSAEIIANVLEYLSSKPVILFSTMRGISRLFHQGVVLNFERHYFQKRTPKPSNWPEFFLPDAFVATTQISFSFSAPRVLRTFLTVFPWMSEACLQSVETLAVSFSSSEETLRILGRWLPNVRNLQISGGDAKKFTKQIVDTILRDFPLLTTIHLRDYIDQTARDILVTNILAKKNCRLGMDGGLLPVLAPFDSSPLDSLKPYADLFTNLTWLEFQDVDLGTFDLFPHCVNLEVLALASLTLRESFFRTWKFCDAGCQRKSLRSFELSYIRFIGDSSSPQVPSEEDVEEFFSLNPGDSSSPQVPPSEDVEEFFPLNPDLMCLVMDLKAEEFPNSWAGSVGRHCHRLQYLSFSDGGCLPLEDLEALVTTLGQLKFVHAEVKTDTFEPERMTLLARFDNLHHLRLAQSTRIPSLPHLKMPKLELLSLSSSAPPDDISSSPVLG
jgi:hypothetical protein